MRKSLKDLFSGNPDKERINLKGDASSRPKKLKKKNSFSLKTEKDPIHRVSDIKGQEPKHFNYIKAKKFNPPWYLSSILAFTFLAFLLLFFINGLNIYFSTKDLQDNIKADALDGFSYLVDAGENATQNQFDQALNSFESAIANFDEAKTKLWFITTDQSLYAEEDNVTKAVANLLKAGKEFSLSGNDFLAALEEFNKIPLYFAATNNDDSKLKPSITDTLQSGLEHTDKALVKVNAAYDLISEIKEQTLPVEIRSRVVQARSQVEQVMNLLNSISNHFPALLKLLGDRYPHRYLVLLQNNSEVRATGGFIGSYAIIDVNEGYIENLKVHDVYDIDNFYAGYIEPPKELEPHTTNLRFRDSNYFQDFALSARKASWVLEKQGGPSADTVVAINQGLLRDLLEITGPIQVGDFGKLNSTNYDLLLSFVIEGKIWGAENPKHILKVFVQAFKDEVIKEEYLPELGFKLYRALGQKHIMFYSHDEEIQDFFESFDLAGRSHRPQENEDYFSLINWSTGGTKSEKYIEESIHHHTDIDSAGTITNTVTIKRKHTWNEDVLREWERILSQYGLSTYEAPGILIDILGRGRNRTTNRIYVPAGSILMDSSSADTETIYDADLKMTYFKTETELNTGESSEITLSYQLPFSLNLSQSADTYRLIAEKQPGTPGSLFTKSIQADPSLKNLAFYPQKYSLDYQGNIVYPTNLVYDKYFAGVFAK